MKNLYRMFSGVAVAMLLAVGSSQAMAGPVYTFSFESTSGDYQDIVSGRIFGLSLGDGDSSDGDLASEVIVDTGPLIGDGGLTFSPGAQSFSVDMGEILSGTFIGVTGDAFICINTGPKAALGFCSGRSFESIPNYTTGESFLIVSTLIGDSRTFKIADSGSSFAESQLQSVPAPAPLLMLAIGLCLLRTRRSTTASRS